VVEFVTETGTDEVNAGKLVKVSQLVAGSTELAWTS
jgi:hypothetical protein